MEEFRQSSDRELKREADGEDGGNGGEAGGGK